MNPRGFNEKLRNGFFDGRSIKEVGRVSFLSLYRYLVQYLKSSFGANLYMDGRKEM